MDVYPGMDVYYPRAEEANLAAEMARRATGAWKTCGSPVSRPIQDGQHFFHREADMTVPACIVCVDREGSGHMVVRNIVPDQKVDRLSIEQYVVVLNEFNSKIAEPAAEAVEGMTAIETNKRTLEDYFSKDSIDLLEYFCKSSNGYGGHPSDQKKWRAFLIHVHRREQERVHGDTFGRLLAATQWFPTDGVRELARQYDFAMELLDQNDTADS